jgi:hypothetical protein
VVSLPVPAGLSDLSAGVARRRPGRLRKSALLAGTAPPPEKPKESQSPQPDYTRFNSAPSYPIDTTRTGATDDLRPPRRALQAGQARAPPADRNALLTVEQLSDWWNISVSALNKARLIGSGPKFVRLLRGTAIRYRVGDCLDYLDSRAVLSTSAPECEKASTV